ncbi:MAG: glycosyltransferase family 4 protein [Nanoarchaeota archaeon]|nr:glycosyltransferase family 4 protein [Nanoarchaeota archaeon]
MKICFLNENLDIKTGIGRFGLDIIENVSKDKNFGISILTEKNCGHKFEKPILKKSYLLRNFINIFINAIKIRKYVKNCDIIHALDAYPYGVIAALANIGLKRKLIINGIGTYSILPLDEPIKKILLKWAYKKADEIICISNFTKQQILRRINLNNTVVINPGVDYNKFQIKIKLEEKKEKIILSVGVLKPRKGYHISIPAIAEVKEKYPDIKYYIVGGNPPKIYLDLVREYNLVENVKFFKIISDEELIKLYYQADIFLLTPVTINNNDFEGFGLVYLEAGACEKPTIGTLNCGAEDAVTDDITGLLVPQEDIKKTTEAILKLLDNPELAKRLGENGKKKAKEMDWNNVVKKYIAVYENNFN